MPWPRYAAATTSACRSSGSSPTRPTHTPTRNALRCGRIKATIPEKSDQIARRKAKGSAGGRPPAFDAGVYKQRNIVERCINRIKQFWAVATRYAKRAAYFRSEVIIACIMLHLQ
ncbi:transposase [Kineococcus aurantiacus]|uniref:Transposase n=1 Tax=Kineococcus aurantiacus TaxID=37633 RepID=A0A7Y9DQM1_9ACTN|nr:transposase [Kineococcus aurantiacus]